VRDLSYSTYQRKKVSPNRVKVQREPIDLRKYLRPLRGIALRLSGAALISALVIAGYRALNSATFFRLKNIEVNGGRHVTREEILAIAGVGAGNDLLRMNLRQMGEQLTRNPWVETVRIRRFFPDTLSIAVSEREPLAVVNMGFIYYLDKKGVVFKVLNQGDRLDFPVVTGFSEEELSTDPAGGKEALRAACELLKILQEKGAFILADVSEIHYDKGYGFTMYTASGALPVKIGSGDFAAKLDRFARIYRELMAQQPSLNFIDLDYNDRIVVKRS
jgi:cell division septal protein FtsQ